MAYTIALFFHITGTLLLAASFAIEWACIRGLRNSRTLDEARICLIPYSKLPMIGGIGSAVILLAGVYMTFDEWGWAEWIIVSFVGWVILGATGGIITGKKMRAIEEALKQEDRRLDTVQSITADPAVTASFWVRITMLLGIVYMMTAKPGLWESVIVLLISILLGLISLKSREQPASTAAVSENLS